MGMLLGSHHNTGQAKRTKWRSRCVARFTVQQSWRFTAENRRFHSNRWPWWFGKNLGAKRQPIVAAKRIVGPFVGRCIGSGQYRWPNDCQQFARFGLVFLAFRNGRVDQSGGIGTGRPVDGCLFAVRQIRNIRIARGKNFVVQRRNGQSGTGTWSTEWKVHAKYCLCRLSVIVFVVVVVLTRTKHFS